MGMVAGLLGCLFGILGIFTSGIIFVPLAALCAVVGLLRGIGGRSAAGVGTSLLAVVLSVIGFAVSPSLWLIAGGLLVASQADGTNATTDLSPSAPMAHPQPVEAKTAPQQLDVLDCDRPAGSPLDPNRASDGVPSEKIDTTAAISSCAKSVKENPTNVRFQFEYGRAFDAAKRYDEAIPWYRAAADHGYSAAQVGLGLSYYYGHGVPQNYDAAMQWLRKAADQGNAVAENTLGVMFINGQAVSRNYNEAMNWYRLAADHGLDTAQTNLGGMYYLGQGVAQNYSEAMKWYRKAADQGNADAQNTVGAMYESGRSVPQDYAQAAVWYRKAADQDNAVAQHNLGVLYRDGHGVAQNYAEAAVWFRKAAEHGNVKAQYDLGARYYRGQGVETDYAEALKWFRKAADQGDAGAQDVVGGMYANGMGVARDYPEAVKWLRKAAEQGNVEAQANLAALHDQVSALPITEPVVHPEEELDVRKPMYLTRGMWLCQDETNTDRKRHSALEDYEGHPTIEGKNKLLALGCVYMTKDAPIVLRRVVDSDSITVSPNINSKMRATIWSNDLRNATSPKVPTPASPEPRLTVADTDNVGSPPMPKGESLLIAAVEKSRAAYAAGANDMARGAARPARAREICAVLNNPRIANWVGTIETLSSNSDGLGVLSVLVAEGISIKTWNNALSDTAYQTLIDPASPVFKIAVTLKEGQKVSFGGQFFPDPTDCIKESSLTLKGSLTKPEFIFRFSNITPVE